MYCRWLNTDEELLIGESIVIKALDVRRGKIRIGIIAPDSVSIATREQAASRLLQFVKTRKAG